MSGLQGEQRSFPIETSAIPGEASAGTDDTVARNNDRDRVVAVGQADGASGARSADLFCNLTIGPGLTERDRQQRLPDSPLKLGASQIELEVEGGELAGKLRVQLVHCVVERLGIWRPTIATRFVGLVDHP
jgi:hypothetical protein